MLEVTTQASCLKTEDASSLTTEIVVVVFGFTSLLTSLVISVAFYSEREKSDKFCSEALILA